MAEYRKKPVVVEAFQLNVDDIPLWFAQAVSDGKAELTSGLSGLMAEIETLEGRHHAHYWDYIIRGVKGEIYPCKPDIFEQTYERANAADVVERKRGEWWIEDDGFGCELMTCSVCKASFYDGDNDTVDSPHNFCPNCGADMRSHQNILCDQGERRDNE